MKSAIRLLSTVLLLLAFGALLFGCNKKKRKKRERTSKAFKQAVSLRLQACGCVGAPMEMVCYKKALKRRNTVWVGLKKFRSRKERRRAKRAIRKADTCLRGLSKKHRKNLMNKAFKGIRKGKRKRMMKLIEKAVMKVGMN